MPERRPLSPPLRNAGEVAAKPTEGATSSPASARPAPPPPHCVGSPSPASQGRRIRPTRRALLTVAPSLALASRAVAAAPAPDFAAIERSTGGRLGVFVIDTATGATAGWRADSRFPFCSSFKAPLAGMVLWMTERGQLGLDDRLPYTAADLARAGYAPVTQAHLAQGAMAVRDLCAAAFDFSDNGAANLLLHRVGGPEALTRWMRANGDGAFDLSHFEPELNHARFEGPIDTTTPRAMAQTFRRLALGAILAPASRDQWVRWLLLNTTGARRLRAGLPHGWPAGDKTGTMDGDLFSTVDIALAWPSPRSAPLVISGFVTGHHSTEAGERALAEVARQAAAWARPGG